MVVGLGPPVSAVALECLAVTQAQVAHSYFGAAQCFQHALCFCLFQPDGLPPPRGLSGTGIDGWLEGDFDRLHT